MASEKRWSASNSEKEDPSDEWLGECVDEIGSEGRKHLKISKNSCELCSMFPMGEPGLLQGLWLEKGSPNSIGGVVEDSENAPSLRDVILLNCRNKLEFRIDSFSRQSSLR
jgi:hypothetical protein